MLKRVSCLINFTKNNVFAKKSAVLRKYYCLFPRPKVYQNQKLLSETAEYAELCKSDLTKAIALAKAKREPSGDLWEYDLSNSNKRVVLENRLGWLIINNKSLINTLDSAAEQIKYIKYIQNRIASDL